MNLEISQILSQVIAFLITVWVLKRFAWKPLLGIMEERQRKIKSEFDSIENQKNEIHRVEEEYKEKFAHIETKARIKIQEAIQEGHRIAQEIQDEARQQARNILNKTQAELEIEIGKAKSQLKNEIINISMAAAQKIIQGELSPEKHKKLISEFIDDAELNK